MTSVRSTLTRSELRVAARDGEQLLLTAGLPVLLLVFFGLIDVLPSGEGDRVDFLAPGILVVALLGTGFVRLAIALGFDRAFGAIDRYAVSPVKVVDFLSSRALASAVIAVVQLLVLTGVGMALGWRPAFHPGFVAVVALALAAFFGLGLALGSTAEGLRSLALANTAYIVLLLFSGVVFDLGELPGGVASVARLLPTSAAAELLRSTTEAASGSMGDWLVLLAWAIVGPALAVRTFRWR